MHIQHYSPLGSELSEVVASHTLASAPKDTVSTKVVIMVPGEWTVDASGKYVMTAQDVRQEDRLRTIVREGAPSPIDIQTYPYDCDLRDGDNRQGTLLVECLPGEATRVWAEWAKVAGM